MFCHIVVSAFPSTTFFAFFLASSPSRSEVCVTRFTLGWVIDRSFTPVSQQVTPSHVGVGFEEPHLQLMF